MNGKLRLYVSSDCFVVAAGQWGVPGSPWQLGASGVVYGSRYLSPSLHDSWHQDQQKVQELFSVNH